jgi:hypothetical protein
MDAPRRATERLPGTSRVLKHGSGLRLADRGAGRSPRSRQPTAVLDTRRRLCRGREATQRRESRMRERSCRPTTRYTGKAASPRPPSTPSVRDASPNTAGARGRQAGRAGQRRAPRAGDARSPRTRSPRRPGRTGDLGGIRDEVQGRRVGGGRRSRDISTTMGSSTRSTRRGRGRSIRQVRPGERGVFSPPARGAWPALQEAESGVLDDGPSRSYPVGRLGDPSPVQGACTDRSFAVVLRGGEWRCSVAD